MRERVKIEQVSEVLNKKVSVEVGVRERVKIEQVSEFLNLSAFKRM